MLFHNWRIESHLFDERKVPIVVEETSDFLGFPFLDGLSSMPFLSRQEIQHSQIFPVWQGILWLAAERMCDGCGISLSFARRSCFRSHHIGPPWQHFSLSCSWKWPTPYSTDMVFLEPNTCSFYLTVNADEVIRNTLIKGQSSGNTATTFHVSLSLPHRKMTTWTQCSSEIRDLAL